MTPGAGPPVGRLRPHTPQRPPLWQRVLSGVPYRLLFDPDGRPARMRARRRY